MPTNLRRSRDPATGRLLRVLAGPAAATSSTRFSPDGSTILTASGKNVELWDAADGQRVRALESFADIVLMAGFSNDGERIVTASNDGSLRISASRSGRTEAVLKGLHAGAVYDASFSPDGRAVVSGGHDGTLALWDIASGKAVVQFAHREVIFLNVSFHPDGRRILASTAAGKIALVDLLASYATLVTRARAAAPRCLTPDQRLQANLKSEPPAWCIRSAKWPYHTPEW